MPPGPTWGWTSARVLTAAALAAVVTVISWVAPIFEGGRLETAIHAAAEAVAAELDVEDRRLEESEV